MLGLKLDVKADWEGAESFGHRIALTVGNDVFRTEGRCPVSWLVSEIVLSPAFSYVIDKQFPEPIKKRVEVVDGNENRAIKRPICRCYHHSEEHSSIGTCSKCRCLKLEVRYV